MPAQCYMTKQNGDCCSKPMCTGPDGSQINPLLPGSKYPVYGSFGGGYTGFRPNYTPGQNSVTGNRASEYIMIQKSRILTETLLMFMLIKSVKVNKMG